MATRRPAGVLADFDAWGWPHWFGVVLSLALAGVTAWLGYARGEPPLVLVAGSFLLGVVLFGTRFWQPVLYLVGVVYIGVLLVLWVLTGMQFRQLELLLGALTVALASTALYLFVVAETGRQ